MHARKTTLISLALAATIAIAACSSDRADAPSGAASTSSSSANAVSIVSFAFTPHELEIPVGSELVWSNEDAITHTVTSGVPSDLGVPGVSDPQAAQPDGLFDEELDGAGTTASVTFDEAGTFTYYCDIHPGMNGVIHVT
ncbi:MAG: plastocyanin/azurin family copper-binding protein [Actinomycetota bacterium]